jgi:hypothetical protein
MDERLYLVLMSAQPVAWVLFICHSSLVPTHTHMCTYLRYHNEWGAYSCWIVVFAFYMAKKEVFITASVWLHPASSLAASLAETHQQGQSSKAG